MESRNQKWNSSPAEYTASRPAPFVTVASAAATDRIAARIGPMQGVQPNANRQPHHIGPPQAYRPWNRQPPFPHQKSDPRQPSKCRPMMMMTMPATIESSPTGADQPSDQGGAGAERHEHGGKAEHEHHAAPITARFEDDTASSLTTCSMVAPVRYTR